MDSTVDIAAPSSAVRRDDERLVVLDKAAIVTHSIQVCRLGSGNYAISAIHDKNHIIVDATPHELRALVDQLDALLREHPTP